MHNTNLHTNLPPVHQIAEEKCYLLIHLTSIHLYTSNATSSTQDKVILATILSMQY